MLSCCCSRFNNATGTCKYTSLLINIYFIFSIFYHLSLSLSIYVLRFDLLIVLSSTSSTTPLRRCIIKPRFTLDFSIAKTTSVVGHWIRISRLESVLQVEMIVRIIYKSVYIIIILCNRLFNKYDEVVRFVKLNTWRFKTIIFVVNIRFIILGSEVQWSLPHHSDRG